LLVADGTGGLLDVLSLQAGILHEMGKMELFGEMAEFYVLLCIWV